MSLAKSKSLTLVKKIFISVLIPIFAFSNIALSHEIKTSNDNLAPYWISQLIDETDREIQGRGEEFKQEWPAKFAELIVPKIVKRAETLNIRKPMLEAERELIGLITDRASLDTRWQEALETLEVAIKREFEQLRMNGSARNKQGFLAGFADQALGVDHFGIDLHELLNEATRRKGTRAPGSEAREYSVKDLVKPSDRLTDALRGHEDLKIVVMPEWLDTFKELYREELKKRGVPEPTREKVVTRIFLQIIAHPSTYSGEESIYMDELFFKMLTSADNSDEVLTDLVIHEVTHISEPGLSEEKVNRMAPLDNVKAALKSRTILIAQSGGDCAGLNTVVGASAIELAKKGWLLLGIKEGFTGLASEHLNAFLIPVDRPQAHRLLRRPTTDLRSSREDPFKIVDMVEKYIADSFGMLGKFEEISKIKPKEWSSLSEEQHDMINKFGEFLGEYNEPAKAKYQDWIDGMLHGVKLEYLVGVFNPVQEAAEEIRKYLTEVQDMWDRIVAIEDWKDLSPEESNALNFVGDALKRGYKNSEKDYKKFIATMTNVEGYGGVLVTGGDDHCKVAMKLSQLRRRPDGTYKGRYIAIPKSIDADAMAQMLGFDAAAHHMRERFWQASVTGERGQKVFVGEIMGRKAGWLTLSAANRDTWSKYSKFDELEKLIGKEKADQVRDTIMIIVPEKKVLIRSILLRAQEILDKKGVLNIACSEGFSINEDDPLWKELLDKNPLLAAKVSGPQIKDEHGNIRLAGASEFICGILATDWNAEKIGLPHEWTPIDWNSMRHTVFGYIGRGMKPGDYDQTMGYKYAKKAAELIDRGVSGRMIYYPDAMSPFEKEPLDAQVEEVLEFEGRKLSRNLTTLGEGSEVFGPAKLAERGYEMISDEQLRYAGVIMEDREGRVLCYEIDGARVTAKDTVMGFEDAVRVLRDDFLSTSVSGWAHKRGSIFEVPDNRPEEQGLLTREVASPLDFEGWSEEDLATWEKVVKSILVLSAGRERSFRDIVEEAAQIKAKYGRVNIAVSSGYKVSLEDEYFAKLIEEDDYLRAKFEKTARKTPDGYYTVKDISEFIQGALVKYAPKEFPSESHARTNQLGEMFYVESPSDLEERLDERDREERIDDIEASVQDVDDVKAMIQNHMLLETDGPVETGNMVLIMRKDLPEVLTGKDRMERNPGLAKEYRVMKQNLRKRFPGDEGVIEVDSTDELIAQANNLIKQGLKVIVLDDTTLTGDHAGIEQGINMGDSGEDYCVIAAQAPRLEDDRAIPFINLEAMALMGVGILNDNIRLFHLAYKTFTGMGPTDEVIEHFKQKSWIIGVLPRLIKLTGTMVDEKNIRKLFAAAA